MSLLLAALIGEENLPNLSELVLLLQEGEESLKDGFTVVHKEEEFNFVVEYVDRFDILIIDQCIIIFSIC